MERYPSEYMYGFAHRIPRGKPLEYEQSLLNKHRLEKYKQSYLDDLQLLETYHKEFDRENWSHEADYGKRAVTYPEVV